MDSWLRTLPTGILSGKCPFMANGGFEVRLMPSSSNANPREGRPLRPWHSTCVISVVVLSVGASGCKDVCCKGTDGTFFTDVEGCGEATEVARQDSEDSDEFKADCKETAFSLGAPFLNDDNEILQPPPGGGGGGGAGGAGGADQGGSGSTSEGGSGGAPPVDKATACQAFCAEAAEVCPEDTSCESSCIELAAGIPTASDISCAAAATNCADVNTCFNAFF